MNVNTDLIILDEDDEDYKKNIKENLYEEKNLENNFRNDFTSQIRKRGLEYYEDGNILNLYKNKNKYFAKVEGSDYKIYNVTLIIHQDEIDYNCTCPCDFPCKHEYAVLLAISNEEYIEVELKEVIKEKEIKLKNILENIPAEDIKKYLLSEVGQNNVLFGPKAFKEQFRSYYPTLGYDFYYNNLYNSLVIDNTSKEIIDDYLNRIKGYISGNKFKEVIKISKAIIQAYHDTNKLSYDDNIINMFLKLGMFLRIVYRKSNGETRKDIDEWITRLENKKFYDNYYLEDIMLSIKS